MIKYEDFISFSKVNFQNNSFFGIKLARIGRDRRHNCMMLPRLGLVMALAFLGTATAFSTSHVVTLKNLASDRVGSCFTKRYHSVLQRASPVSKSQLQMSLFDNVFTEIKSSLDPTASRVKQATRNYHFHKILFDHLCRGSSESLARFSSTLPTKTRAEAW